MTTYSKGSGVRVSPHFNSNEFDCKNHKCCDETIIDSELVAILEKIRGHFGKPVRINSAYRCAKHNKEVGGSNNSYHLKGMAADIRISGVKPIEIAKYAESAGVKGIGLYPSFVHVDTRDKKSFWYSHKQEYRSTFGGREDKVMIELKVLEKGSTGYQVKTIQKLLGLVVDGNFGTRTQTAVKAFQKNNGLTADGIVGKATWNKLLTG